MSEATLIAHFGTAKVSREELKAIPVPEGTRTFKPIPHHEIVDALVEALSFRYIGVVRDEYAVSPDGMKMFGVLDLETAFDGCRFAIGIRNANDRSMRLGLTSGATCPGVLEPRVSRRVHAGSCEALEELFHRGFAGDWGGPDSEKLRSTPPASRGVAVQADD